MWSIQNPVSPACSERMEAYFPGSGTSGFTPEKSGSLSVRLLSLMAVSEPRLFSCPAIGATCMFPLSWVICNPAPHTGHFVSWLSVSELNSSRALP